MAIGTVNVGGNDGAASVEYAILAVAIAAAVVLVVVALGADTLGLFECTRVSIETETSSC